MHMTNEKNNKITYHSLVLINDEDLVESVISLFILIKELSYCNLLAYCN